MRQLDNYAGALNFIPSATSPSVFASYVRNASKSSGRISACNRSLPNAAMIRSQTLWLSLNVRGLNAPLSSRRCLWLEAVA